MPLMPAARHAGFGLVLLGILLLASLVTLWESAPAVPPAGRADSGAPVSQDTPRPAQADALAGAPPAPASAGAATPSAQIDPFRVALASRALASPPAAGLTLAAAPAQPEAINPFREALKKEKAAAAPAATSSQARPDPFRDALKRERAALSASPFSGAAQPERPASGP